ncbi:MAG: hypothetical protein QM765_44475, partial [Myxococcales bacterium]
MSTVFAAVLELAVGVSEGLHVRRHDHGARRIPDPAHGDEIALSSIETYCVPTGSAPSRKARTPSKNPGLRVATRWSSRSAAAEILAVLGIGELQAEVVVHAANETGNRVQHRLEMIALVRKLRGRADAPHELAPARWR